MAISEEKASVLIDSAKCVGCGKCIKDCVSQNIIINNGKAKIKSSQCLKCGHCVAICAMDAVSIPEYGTDENEPVSREDILNPDKLIKAIKSRRSIRQFQDIPVEIEKLNMIIEAGRFTPSTRNDQNVSYIVITENNNEAEKEALKIYKIIKKVTGLFSTNKPKNIIDDHFILKKAKAAIVVVSNNKINGALAAANMELMTEALGLGMFYSGYFTVAINMSRKLRKILKMEKGQKAVATLVMGYPDVTYKKTAPRKKAVIHYV